MKYKIIVSDIDGVWTDGSFYYSKNGDAVRKFTTKDGYGIKLCQLMNIPVLVLSTEENDMVRQRMKKLNVKYIKLGVRNKLKNLTSFCNSHGLVLSEVAYIGDDMNDYHLIEKIGFFACPADAYPVIKQKSDIILKSKGGKGAFREFVEYLLQQEGVLEEAYKKYIDECLRK